MNFLVLMNSVKSKKGYVKVDESEDVALKRETRNGKVDEAQDLALKIETRKGLIMMGVTFVLLGSLLAVVPLLRLINNPPSSIPELTPAETLRIVCRLVTRYPASCISSISKLSSSNTTDLEIIFRLSLKVVLDELNSITDLRKKLAETTDDERIKSALVVCGYLFEDPIDRVNKTVSAMDVGDGKNILNSAKIDDLQTWLSAAVTNQDTCLDVLDELSRNANSTILQTLKSAMLNSSEFTSNS